MSIISKPISNNNVDDDYFGKDNTKEGYLNYFLTYASDYDITPKSYAEFTLIKIGRDNSHNNIELTNIQKADLYCLIQVTSLNIPLALHLLPVRTSYVEDPL